MSRSLRALKAVKSILESILTATQHLVAPEPALAFFDLPFEIRTIIYGYTLPYTIMIPQADFAFHVWKGLGPHAAALLKTSRALHAEASEALYAHNTFEIRIAEKPTSRAIPQRQWKRHRPAHILLGHRAYLVHSKLRSRGLDLMRHFYVSMPSRRWYNRLPFKLYVPRNALDYWRPLFEIRHLLARRANLAPILSLTIDGWLLCGGRSIGAAWVQEMAIAEGVRTVRCLATAAGWMLPAERIQQLEEALRAQPQEEAAEEAAAAPGGRAPVRMCKSEHVAPYEPFSGFVRECCGAYGRRGTLAYLRQLYGAACPYAEDGLLLEPPNGRAV